jgi:FG-GAP-like repeat
MKNRLRPLGLASITLAFAGIGCLPSMGESDLATTASEGSALATLREGLSEASLTEQCKAVRVTTANQLQSELEAHTAGCLTLTVPRSTTLDMSGRADIPIRSGVTILGERDAGGTPPMLFSNTKGDSTTPSNALFEILGNDVRIQSLALRGPEHDNRDGSQQRVTGIRVTLDPGHSGRNVVIADNDISEWTQAAVEVRSIYSARVLSEYASDWPYLTSSDAAQVRIEHNYIHHNSMDGEGYGVEVGSGAYATIEANVFDFNRHAVASNGFAHTGYVARFNYVLEGGYTEGSGYYNQHFDVHGTDPKPGTDESSGYGGSAGEYYEIAFNTIRGEQQYSIFGFKTRASFMLRGAPTMGAYFHDNVDVHDDEDAAIALKSSSSDVGVFEDNEAFHFHASGNHYDTDHTTELATGDFDGDGRTDIFVATGTTWFFSRAGGGRWEFLHESTKLTRDLGFADIDNDGVTDVLYRDSAGNVGYLASGRVALVPLTTSPVAMKDMRFGDFDGDGRTDIFYTSGGQWYIWYGAARAWTPVETSSTPISELLFGDFDDVEGTDVAAVNSGGWQYSSAATHSWAHLNSRLTTSFANVVAADFDDDGKDDIAFSDGSAWYFSRNGRSPLETLRRGSGELKHMQIGRFVRRISGRLPHQVLDFDASGLKFAIWYGLGSGDRFGTQMGRNVR